MERITISVSYADDSRLDSCARVHFMTYEDRINEKVVKSVYDTLVETFEVAGISKAEAITALLVLLGTQYNGGPLHADETKRFMAEANSWMIFYFSRLGRKK